MTLPFTKRFQTQCWKLPTNLISCNSRHVWCYSCCKMVYIAIKDMIKWSGLVLKQVENTQQSDAEKWQNELKQFTDKLWKLAASQVGNQVNSRTSQLAEMFDVKFGVSNRSKCGYKNSLSASWLVLQLTDRDVRWAIVATVIICS